MPPPPRQANHFDLPKSVLGLSQGEVKALCWIEFVPNHFPLDLEVVPVMFVLIAISELQSNAL